MVLRETARQAAGPSRQVTFSVPGNVYRKLTEIAGKDGVAVGRCAKTLFEAAYAARCGVQSDPDFDAQVGRVLLMHAVAADTARIAASVGIPESRVVRILNAWREERSLESATGEAGA